MAGLSYEVDLVFLDDKMIFGRSIEEHLNRRDLVLGRLKDAGLKIKGSNCRFFQEKVHCLEHIVSNQGVEVDPEKVAAVGKMKSPRTIKDFEVIFELVGFYRRFIQDFGKIAEPLYKLLNKKNVFLGAKSVNQQLTSKTSFTEAPILGYPNDTDPYTLTTDAFLFDIGAIISKDNNGVKELLHTQAKRSTKVNKTILRQNENFLQ